ncbi:MAG: tRNA 2-thiouridine(34) synthase MnmA [Oscillospiraceae bacterium]|nr:tRNA 2-thiouridine(34) synthase MnmA [Oscillospiraceae bacterium]
MNKKAVIAMSGGVDSSVAAYLMKKDGFDCIGVTMKLFHNEDIEVSREKTCCSLDDVNDAQRVAFAMDMPHYVFNFSDEFKEKVIDRFVSAYENGETPDPCIDCNRYLKFDKLYHRARELDCDYIVTGHYARIELDRQSGRYLLKKAAYPEKDQSYVLYAMTQEQLAHTMFPLGNYTKPEIREIAEEQGFLNAKKHDSQDICFVPNGSYADFIEYYTKRTYPGGDFVDTSGNVLGEHKGIIRYTIGQRKGLGISYTEPLYVLNIDKDKNTVTVGKDSELYSKRLTAGNINLISVENIDKPMRVKAKIRYRHAEQPATVIQVNDKLEVTFDEPQRAITRGQAVVLYDGDTVVGGGTIL